MKDRSRHPVRSAALVLGAAGALMGAAALVARWEERHAIEPERLAGPDSQFLDISGLRVHLTVAGEGRPVLVLHHGLFANLSTWQHVLAPLAKLGMVIAFDRPGFGLTSRPLPEEWVGANPYTPEASADLTIALLNRFEVEQAVLVGHSAGAAIAVLTALRHPDRVQALVLVSPALTVLRQPPARLRTLLRSAPVRPVLPVGLRAAALLGGTILRRSVYDPSTVTAEMVQAYRSPVGLQHWDRALVEVSLAQRPVPIDDRLRELTIPALVVIGAGDRLVGTADGVQLAQSLPNARLVVMPETGHIPQEERPEAFVNAVERFLARLPSTEGVPA